MFNLFSQTTPSITEEGNPFVEEQIIIEADKIQEAPTEPDPLAKKWKSKIEAARKHWKPFFDRCAHNRKLVSGFDWDDRDRNPNSDEFYGLRTNLILSTIASILPNLYARNPEMSIVPVRSSDEESQRLEMFCNTLSTVLNVYLERANLKKRGKATVRSALTCSYGIAKVVYQEDLAEDPMIKGRIQDAQDNLARIDGLLSRMTDDDMGRDEIEAQRMEFEQTLQGLQADIEPDQVEGLIIDRVLTDQLLIDPSVVDFDDYVQADWMAQIIPMRRSTAEELFKIKITGAKTFKSTLDKAMAVTVDSGKNKETDGDSDDQVCILEIWDRISQRVYTMAEGCNYFLREPYSPEKIGGRWYPFFLLPYNQVDGKFIAPSLVDLIEKLQTEHNETRETFVEHRRLCKPGFVASADVDEKSLQRFTDSVLGEVIVLKNSDGQDVRSMILPKQTPPVDPAVYDTSIIRQDIEQVTGLQDAMRSTVVQPKTATEAQIMQQGLSGRVNSFRDDVEDWLQELATYAAQVLLRSLKEEDVARIMGNPKVDALGVMIDKPYDWPSLTTKQVSQLIKIKIKAGSTGSPDRLQQQESWGKLLPTIQGLVQQVYQLKMQGVDAGPVETLLRESVRRFDDRIDVNMLIPDIEPPMMQQPMQAQGALPPEVAQQLMAQQSTNSQQQ